MRPYDQRHPDSVETVAYLALCAVALNLASVRIERGRLSLGAIAIGAAAVLTNPLDATVIGLITGVAQIRRVAPPVDAIVSWAEKASEPEQRRRERLVSTADGFAAASSPMRLHLEWRAGDVDTSAWRVGQTAALEQASPFFGNAATREEPFAEFPIAVDVNPDDLEDAREPVAAQSAPYEKEPVR